MKMSRIDQLGQALAYYISNPVDAIEIGGVSSQLNEIIKIQTKGNKRLRDKVFEWLEYYIEGEGTTVEEYIDDIQAAFDDYDKNFYE